MEDALSASPTGHRDESVDTVVKAVHEIQARRACENAEAVNLIAAKRSGLRGKIAKRSAIEAEKDAKAASSQEARLSPEEALAAASDMLNELYDRLAELDMSAAEARAGSILSGLGFSPKQQGSPTSTLSGGWRTRLALASALFASCDLLLLVCTALVSLCGNWAWLYRHLCFTSFFSF